MAGEQANAERLDPGRQSVLKGLAGEAAPHARLVVKAGDKLLLLSTLGALRTLELNAQVLLEPVNRLANAVDERLDEFGVGNAAADGQDGVDEVLLVVFVNGSDKPRPQVPGKKLDPLIVLPALATVTVAPCVPLRWRRKGPQCQIQLPVHQSIPSDSFLVRRIVARVIGNGAAKTRQIGKGQIWQVGVMDALTLHLFTSRISPQLIYRH